MIDIGVTSLILKREFPIEKDVYVVGCVMTLSSEWRSDEKIQKKKDYFFSESSTNQFI